MPLQPPGDLAGFPARRSSARLRGVYRIGWHRDRAGVVSTSPWRFSSLPGPARGRFDLPAPRGTCYWSSHRYGAWLEVFRNATVIDSADAARRTLWTGHGPPTRLADLLSTRAYRYGVTAAISTQPDYTIPRLHAAGLAGQGFQGVVGTCSHDTTSTALNIALFGPAGRQAAHPGWTVSLSPVANDLPLLRELAKYGVHLAPPPYSVPTTPPPD
jgi:hypothetical protein